LIEELQTFREFRDEYLLANQLGQAFADSYYSVSLPINTIIIDHPSLKPMVRVVVLPAVDISTLVVNTTVSEKMGIGGLFVLASAAVAIWVMRQRGRGPEYT